MTPKWVNAAVFLLLIIGLLQTIGYIVGSESIMDIGFATGSSPHIILASSENYTNSLENIIDVTLLTSDNQSLHYDNMYHFLRSIDGPHQRRRMYIVPLLWWPTFQDDLAYSAIEYGFCNHGPILESMNIQEDIVQADVLIRGYEHDLPKNWSVLVRCTP